MTATKTSSTWQQSANLLASSTLHCELDHTVTLSDELIPEEGYCVAVKALAEKETYGNVECVDGTFRKIRKGDVLVGVLGSRQALKGYCGTVPDNLQVGDHLNVLNLGGIIGDCTSEFPALGPALPVEVLGAVMANSPGTTQHASIRNQAVPPVDVLTDVPPLVIVSGTSMSTGKTTAACKIVAGLAQKGFTVDAAKLTGASLMRDVRQMKENGARHCLTFTDAGLVSTTGHSMQPYARGLVSQLASYQPDVIVLEMGDGLIGYYGVDDIMRDPQLQKFAAVHIVAANDLAGVWAAQQLFSDHYGSTIAAVTGPVTDHDAGKSFIESEMDIRAMNARSDMHALNELISTSLLRFA